jgi:hypothetical protein
MGRCGCTANGCQVRRCATFYNRHGSRAARCEPMNAPAPRGKQVGPDQTPGPTRVLPLASSALAESERAGGTLRKPVELPRVCGSLNLRLHLSLRIIRIEVVQPARGAARVRVSQSPRPIGVVHLVWRTLDLTSKCRASARKCAWPSEVNEVNYERARMPKGQ